MTDQDFDFICKLLRERCAIVLESGKEYLVESRLTPVVKQLNLTSIGDLVRQMRTHPANGLQTRVMEAMVTTETSFFRDHAPFEAMRKAVLPELLARRKEERRLRIWCAATSTGQEPYSIAMLVRDHFPELMNWDLTILASDISTEMLNRAREGRYSQLEVNRGLPITLLMKYFKQHGTHWHLNDTIRAMVQFREINLAQPWPPMSRMDLVCVRNVMIYFDVETKKAILKKLAQVLRPDGYLLLGGAETTFNLDDSYRRVEHLKTSFYQQNG